MRHLIFHRGRRTNRAPVTTSSLLAALLCATVAISAAVAAPSGAQFPTDPEEAMRHFEAEIDDWHRGPVQYLLLEDERKTWRELRSEDEKRRFIRWFWDRRDDDPRDNVIPFRGGFYTRVATANKRFPGFPRGWRSDRGRDAWNSL